MFLSPHRATAPPRALFSLTLGVSPHAFWYPVQVYGPAAIAPSAKAIVTQPNCDNFATTAPQSRSP
jgi:hypothetical protein